MHNGVRYVWWFCASIHSEGIPLVAVSKDLIAASSTPLVLSILRDGESYGYAIIRRVKELSGSEIEWTDGMLYPVLHRLEALGLIEATWKTAQTGRRRKYYNLTEQGRRELQVQISDWKMVNDTLERAWEDGDVQD